MEVTILISDINHPDIPRLQEWCSLNHQTLAVGIDGLPGGDILFALSCTEHVPLDKRALYKKCFVIHESALPRGRGWSPVAWQILEGERIIPVSMIEMADSIDTGDMYGYLAAQLDGTELYQEIRDKICAIKLRLVGWASANGQPSFCWNPIS